MLRGIVRLLVPTMLAGLVMVPAGARADAGCAWPANPGGQVVFGVDPVQVPVGEPIGWHIEFDQPGESDYIVGAVYEIDGPDGRHTVTSGNGYGGASYIPTAPGTYTVSGGWTEHCGDGVTPDRTVTARGATFEALGPQPPYIDVFLQNGGMRLGHGRSPATAQIVVQCPSQAPSGAAFSVRVTHRGRVVAGSRAHGCIGYSRIVTQSRHGKTWAISADGKGGRVFVAKGVRRSATLELLSGGTSLARFTAVFTAGRRGEAVALRAHSCPGTTCQVIRIKRKDVIPLTS